MIEEDNVPKECGELRHATTKETELSQKVVPIPRPPPAFL